MIILGIETSCDESAAAIMENDERLLSSVVNSQIEVHGKYGGVVPELASRKHIENIHPVVMESLSQAEISLEQVDGIAVTRGPGLTGSLLVGVSFAKALAMVRKIPYTGIDHMAGHLLSVHLSEKKPPFPYIALVASGGHSSIYAVYGPRDFKLIGQTRDDAAGEAFDKVAKILGLGYPGGPVISRLAEKGNAEKISFPRSWLEPDSFDFSFSGIKTAVASYVNNNISPDKTGKLPSNGPFGHLPCHDSPSPQSAVQAGTVKGAPSIVHDICASFQEAIIDVLIEKTIRAALHYKIDNIAICGGVAANNRLRMLMKKQGQGSGLNIFMAPVQYCTDNAAMIALAGYFYLPENGLYSYDMDVYSRVVLTERI
ncbi:MAG: tRNA (adenosine(37)-N6)-threonylcarbamoyltransferase complex transferase subunit TsaD [Desulfobia sp.]